MFSVEVSEKKMLQYTNMSSVELLVQIQQKKHQNIVETCSELAIKTPGRRQWYRLDDLEK